MAKDSSLPLYYQIVVDLKQQIEKGVFPNGEKLPAEQAIVKKYGVSRVTVQKAFDELIKDGYVERVINKGHFVKFESGKNKSVYSIRSLTSSMREVGITPGTKIVSLRMELCTPALAKIFLCRAGEPMIVIHRIRYADDVPLMDEDIYLREKMFQNFNALALMEQSLWSIIEQDYHYKILHSVQMLEAAYPTKEQIKNLELKTKKPQLHIRSTIILENGLVAEHSDCCYLFEVFPYSFTWHN